jgi:anti-repressor protein
MELIQINKDVQVGREVIQTVNARELHGFLGSSKQFSNWIRERIERYGFTENVDYVSSKLSSLNGGAAKIEYHVSVGMAKELAMVERNAQGKQARLYFIECERKLQEIAPASALPSYPDALRQLAATLERNEQQAVQIAQQTSLIEAQKPAVEFVAQYVEADGLKGFRSVAKLLGANEREFRNFLVDRKIQYRLEGKYTHFSQYGIDKAGYFDTKTSFNPSTGGTYNQSYFTPKGVEWITRKWSERVPVLTRKTSPVKISRELIDA